MVMMLVGGSVARPDKDAMDRFWGNLTGEVRLEKPGDTSIADLFGKVLDNEFKENDTPERRVFILFLFLFLIGFFDLVLNFFFF